MDGQEIVMLVILCIVFLICCVCWMMCVLVPCKPKPLEEGRLVASEA